MVTPHPLDVRLRVASWWLLLLGTLNVATVVAGIVSAIGGEASTSQALVSHPLRVASTATLGIAELAMGVAVRRGTRGVVMVAMLVALVAALRSMLSANPSDLWSYAMFALVALLGSVVFDRRVVT